MIVDLKHAYIRRFNSQGYPVSKIVKDLISKEKYTFNYFCNLIVKNSEKYEKDCKFYAGENARNDFCGYVFEIFSEFLININVGNPAMGIIDYQPVIGDDDYGVDGYGKSLTNFKPVTVQIKFRSNPNYFLTTEDRISNFYSKSLSSYFSEYKLSELEPYNMLIITSCAGVNFKCMKEIFNDKIKVLARKDLEKFTDNRIGFWQLFFESLENHEKKQN